MARNLLCSRNLKEHTMRILLKNQYLAKYGLHELAYQTLYHRHFFCIDRAFEDLQNGNKICQEICCAPEI